MGVVLALVLDLYVGKMFGMCLSVLVTYDGIHYQHRPDRRRPQPHTQPKTNNTIGFLFDGHFS